MRQRTDSTLSFGTPIPSLYMIERNCIATILPFSADILNQRKSLQRSASSSGFYESYAEQLRSYFLISLRYKFNRMN